jgi:hypothetical protein
MRSKAWLAVRVSLRLACMPRTASSAQRSHRLRSTRAAAPVLLALAEVTKSINIFSMGPKLRYPVVLRRRLCYILIVVTAASAVDAGSTAPPAATPGFEHMHTHCLEDIGRIPTPTSFVVATRFTPPINAKENRECIGSARALSLAKLARDDLCNSLQLNVGRAFVNGANLAVTVEFLDREVLCEANAAHPLDAARCRAVSQLHKQQATEGRNAETYCFCLPWGA